MCDLRGLKAGDTVKVTGGPFSGDTVTVQSVDRERGRVRVLVLIFGDPTTVDMLLSDVEWLD